MLPTQDLQTGLRLSAAEFLALPETDKLIELIEGVLVVRNTPNVSHQAAVRNTFKVLDKLNLGGELFFAPLTVYLDDANFLQPDILWVAPDGRAEITPEGINGAPDLVVEVLSPSTAQYDRGAKFRIYQQQGVREYWLLDPETQRLEIWQLTDGQFVLHGNWGAADSATSPLLGQVISVNMLFNG